VVQKNKQKTAVKILVTGTAGFIGYHLVKRLALEVKNTIIGIDNIKKKCWQFWKKKRLQNHKIHITTKNPYLNINRIETYNFK
jgi:nucleoside-diphosphate-sugar epimerase